MREVLGSAELCYVQLELHKLLCLLTMLTCCQVYNNDAASFSVKHWEHGLLVVLPQPSIIPISAFKSYKHAPHQEMDLFSCSQAETQN